jgi:hypothetical protein
MSKKGMIELQLEKERVKITIPHPTERIKFAVVPNSRRKTPIDAIVKRKRKTINQ